MAPFTVRTASWEEVKDGARSVRVAVFVQEQQIPEELEWDGLDPQCLHALALDEAGRAIGTARLTPAGRIGRMAVLPPWRGCGVGTALLETLLEAARSRGIQIVCLHAQTTAVGFYARFGFQAVGEVFLEAGIPHVGMERAL